MTLHSGSAQSLEANVLGGLHNPCQKTKAYNKALSEWCLNANDYLQGYCYETDIGHYVEYPE